MSAVTDYVALRKPARTHAMRKEGARSRPRSTLSLVYAVLLRTGSDSVCLYEL